MNPYVLPPITACVVAIVLSLSRYLSAIILQLESFAPPAQTISLYVGASRFVAFVLVYGLLFGLAYWAGTQRPDPQRDGRLVAATGAAGVVGSLLGAGIVLWLLEFSDGWLIGLVTMGGASVAIGVQLAIVTFAGLALGRR